MVVLIQIINKRNTHIHAQITSEVLVVEKSYIHWNTLIMFPICFGYDSSEPSGREQKDVLVMQNVCIVIYYFTGFTQYLLYDGYFAINVYNALPLILVFLTDVATTFTLEVVLFSPPKNQAPIALMY